MLKEHISRLQEKQSLLTDKLDALAKKLRIAEPTMDERIQCIRKERARLEELNPHKMKSKVQSYDIRDSEEFDGVLELEKQLKTISTEELLNQPRPKGSKVTEPADDSDGLMLEDGMMSRRRELDETLGVNDMVQSNPVAVKESRSYGGKSNKISPL